MLPSVPSSLARAIFAIGTPKWMLTFVYFRVPMHFTEFEYFEMPLSSINSSDMLGAFNATEYGTVVMAN